MKLALIFDALFIACVIYFSYYAYKNQYYDKFFEYIKIFLFFAIAAHFAPIANMLFHKLHLIQADRHTIGILIAFAFNFSVLYFGYKSIFKFTNSIIQSQKFKTNLAKLVSFLEALVIISFFVFILMQVKPIKSFSQNFLMQSYSYPVIRRFYVTVINEQFNSMFMQSDSKLERHEAIFKSVKGSI